MQNNKHFYSSSVYGHYTAHEPKKALWHYNGDLWYVYATGNIDLVISIYMLALLFLLPTYRLSNIATGVAH